MSQTYDYQQILNTIEESLRPYCNRGDIADYIPELAKIDSDQFAMSLCFNDGREYSVGDFRTPFSIQSISKVFVLTIAMQLVGEELWGRVDREPSGNAFNSLVQLETEMGIPRNPFINAGALISTDVIIQETNNAYDEILDLVRRISLNQNIKFNEKVANSEYSEGDRNAALAYFMKSFGNINSTVDELLRVYFAHCSIEMNTLDLARSFLFLANGGIVPYTGDVIIPAGSAKRINSIMMTCGLYNNVGDFAYSVGLPAKSGVGGGIAAVLPGEFSLAVWSPGLNENGNSLRGIKGMEIFTSLTNQSIF
ncbi:MAG: glutaminase [Bacteriovoracaceae bacterium]|nr:glutaminase [Bacteriovoracaceae bacterium]